MTKLILVDDERIFLNSMLKYIHTSLPEFEVCGCFQNGCDAMEYLSTHTIDIIVTDVAMPEMDGLELCRQVHELDPSCVCIILSGFSEFEYARKALKYDAFQYLLKPVNYKEFGDCLKDAQHLSQIRRGSLISQISLSAQEVFLGDLITGAVMSHLELEKKMLSLDFSFSLQCSWGYLVKAIPSAAENMQVLSSKLVMMKETLQKLFLSEELFFLRRSSSAFHFLVISKSTPDEASLLQANSKLSLALQADCNLKIYRTFHNLLEFVKQVPVPDKEKPEIRATSIQIQKALDYIQQHFSEAISRESVAENVFLSPSYFSKQFRKETGISFMDYLTKIRIDHAIKLLATSAKINDIAEQVGYLNRNRFIINFRAQVGCTPTEYRLKALSNEESSNE